MKNRAWNFYLSTEKCLIFIVRSCWKNYKFFVAKPFPGVAYPLKLRTSLISLDLLNLTDLPNFRTSFSERGIESSFDLGKIFGYKKSCGELSLFKCRAVGRSGNSGAPALLGGQTRSLASERKKIVKSFNHFDFLLLFTLKQILSQKIVEFTWTNAFYKSMYFK